MRLLLASFLCAFASGLWAADTDADHRVVDEVRNPVSLIGVGRELSLRTDELGMGGYAFKGRGVRFSGMLVSNVAACLNLGPGERPSKPPKCLEEVLVLTYCSPRPASFEAINDWNDAGWAEHTGFAVRNRWDGKAILRAELRLENGVTYATLKDFVRRFRTEIKPFDRHMKNSRR